MGQAVGGPSDGALGGWFGVRCVFLDANNGIYEERVTLWRAAGFAEAIALAEAEALEYAAIFDNVRYLELAQAYSIGEEEPGHGSEVFSLMRDSDLGEEEYLDRFFVTGDEREAHL
ncbi:hypothetical protein [Actinoallomurus sp. NPDC050550]|uniref:hypothetical protein n=1 Tax=Actinoallomurus sp. NPDC050550 TaxID=3154937 RepID=UPI0034019CAD